MEKRITKNNGEVENRISKRMDDQVLAFKALHEGQVHMEENLRMIMKQVGLHPTMRPREKSTESAAAKRKEGEESVGSDTNVGKKRETEGEDVEMYEEYSISPEQFDAVLTQVEIQRGQRAADGSPAKKIPKQSSNHEVMEDDL